MVSCNQVFSQVSTEGRFRGRAVARGCVGFRAAFGWRSPRLGNFGTVHLRNSDFERADRFRKIRLMYIVLYPLQNDFRAQTRQRDGFSPVARANRWEDACPLKQISHRLVKTFQNWISIVLNSVGGVYRKLFWMQNGSIRTGINHFIIGKDFHWYCHSLLHSLRDTR